MIKPEIGQILYSLNIGNAARHTEQKLTPVIVTKVGRKYFTCTQESSRFGAEYYEYYLDDWTEKTEYSPSSFLYSDPQVWEDEKERDYLLKLIKDEINTYHNNERLTLEKLREIAKILFAK